MCELMYLFLSLGLKPFPLIFTVQYTHSTKPSVPCAGYSAVSDAPIRRATGPCQRVVLVVSSQVGSSSRCSALDYTFVVNPLRYQRRRAQGIEGVRTYVHVLTLSIRVYTQARTKIIINNSWFGSRNVVSDSASFSILNAVVLAKSPIYFSSACYTKAVGIAYKLSRFL